MAWYRKVDREEVLELPPGSVSVGAYAALLSCSTSNVHKLAKNGKIRIVKYSGVLFVAP